MAVTPLDMQIALIQIGRASHQYLTNSQKQKKNQLSKEIQNQYKSKSIKSKIQNSPDNLKSTKEINIPNRKNHYNHSKNIKIYKIKTKQNNLSKINETEKGKIIDIFK